MPKAFHAMALLVISCDLVATVKVIVVGAGTSGLAAARTLIDTWDATANGGPLELTVLEAGTRIGGRVWTLNADEAGAAWATAGALGAPTDMGASWIHGSNLSHPITKIATALGLAEGAGLVRTRNSLAELQLCSGQTSSCPSVSDDKYTAYLSLIAQAQQGAEAANLVTNSDKSLWEALSGLSASDQSRSSDLFQFHLASAAEFNTAGPARELSALFYNDDSKYKGNELIWAQGYKTMYEALQSGAVRVTDGSSTLQVTAVEAGSRNPISVTYSKRVRDVSYNSAEVVLTTADNEVYRADYAIITVPLGVLKSSDASSQVTFSPALPPATANGIAQLGFGNVVKVALLFPSAWWPTGTHYYGLAQAGEADRGLFTYFLNVHALSTKPVLMTFALGGAADVAEGMTNAEMWTQVCSPLPLPQISVAYPAGATSAPLTISRASPPHLSRRSGRIWSRSCRVMSRSRRLRLRLSARIGAPILLQRARTRLPKSVRRQSHLRRRGYMSCRSPHPPLSCPECSYQVRQTERQPSRAPLVAMSEGDSSLQASTLRRYTEGPSTARSSLARCASPRASLDLPRASPPLISHAPPLHTSPPTCVSNPPFVPAQKAAREVKVQLRPAQVAARAVKALEEGSGEEGSGEEGSGEEGSGAGRKVAARAVKAEKRIYARLVPFL